MTTNNPDVVCHAVKAVGAPVTLKFIVREDIVDEYMNTLSERHPVVSSSPPIHLSAYEALQAECEKLRTALTESRANDQQAMAYLSEVRAIVGGDDFPDMVRRCEKLRAECEKLRKDAERYRWLADACVSDWLGEEGPVLVHAKPWNTNWRAELDAAIDAAMQEPNQ